MEQEIHITLRFDLATGKATLNEIVYRLKQLQNQLMVKILERILTGYDDPICDRLSGTYPSKEWKGLGHHAKANDPKVGFCRGRKVRNGVIVINPGSFARFLAGRRSL
ncbi:MAG: hypothetical protein U5R49_06680 [Deltaproteobacteria bacterium]|nr:hypothetical protein [Deltaproteobacteria bacterium]